MNLMELNVDVFRTINDLGKQYTYLNPVFVFIAEYMVFILLLSVIAYWFSRLEKNRMMIISASIAFIVAEIVGEVVGMFHSNYQPFVELSNVTKLVERSVDNSFPSDHTILFFTFCFSFYFFKKKCSYLWIVTAFLVGMSRIWVGVHYPADVFVGGVIGVVVAYISYLVVPKLTITKKALLKYERYEKFVLPKKNRVKGA